MNEDQLARLEAVERQLSDLVEQVQDIVEEQHKLIREQEDDGAYEREILYCSNEHTFPTDGKLSEGDPCPKCGERLDLVFVIEDPDPNEVIRQAKEGQ